MEESYAVECGRLCDFYASSQRCAVHERIRFITGKLMGLVEHMFYYSLGISGQRS